MRGIPVSFLIVLGGAMTLTAPPAMAQDACGCAVALCQAMSAAQHGDASHCQQMTRGGAQGCTSIVNAMLPAVRMMGQPLPAACNGMGNGGGSSGSGGGGGGAPGGGAEGPGGSTGGEPSGAPGGSGSASPAPTPLPPDPSPPSSSHGYLVCHISHTGHRVIVAGGSDRFNISCNTPSQGSLAYRWGPQPGELLPLGTTASWTAPTAPGEVHIRPTVNLVDAQHAVIDSVTLDQPIDIVPRHLTLDFDNESILHCNSMDHATVIVGYDQTCHMSINLTVADDLSVSGSAGTSCGSAHYAGITPCSPAPGMIASPVESADPMGNWSLDGVTGNIDNLSMIMTLHANGQRMSGLQVTFRGGRTTTPHSLGLFPLPFTIAPTDGAVRRFGSLTTNSTAGGTTTWTVHTH